MTTTQRAAPGPAAHAQRRGAGAWRAACARGPLPAAATSAPSPPHGFSPRPALALALAAPFGTHRSYPSSHITSLATPAAAPGDALLTRARRAAEQAAPRRASAGSTSGASRFRLGDTEGHGGARRGTGTAAGHRPFSRDPTGQTARRPLSPTWLTLTATLGVTRGVTHGSHCAAPGVTHGSAQTDKGGGAGGARARLRVEHSPAEVTSARSGGLSDVATSCSLLFPDRSKPFSASHPTGHSSANPGRPPPQLEGPPLQVSVPV